MADQHSRAWTIADDPPAPDEDVVAGLAGFPTTQLADAGDQVQVLSGLHHIAGGREICGPVCTVWTVPGDLLFMVKATEVVAAGHVLVVDGAGRQDAALMGEIFSAALKERGCVGAVVDGAVRDLDGIEETGLPVFARHVYPATDTIKGPGAINVAVSCGGVTVNAGDVVRADVNGVVVIPASAAADVLAGAKAVAEREREWVAECGRGRGLTEVLGLEEAFRRRQP